MQYELPLKIVSYEVNLTLYCELFYMICQWLSFEIYYELLKLFEFYF